jgi:hypothetical protein
MKKGTCLRAILFVIISFLIFSKFRKDYILPRLSAIESRYENKAMLYKNKKLKELNHSVILDIKPKYGHYIDKNGYEIEALEFPQGIFLKREELDDNGSFVDYYVDSNGNEIQRIYTEGILSSEKITLSIYESITKIWGDGRIFAFSLKSQNKSTTNFFNVSLQIVKKIEVINGDTFCHLWNNRKRIFKTYKEKCQNDNFNEFEDQRYN